MTTVTDVVFGAASDGSQGDTVRTGFTKVNQNVQALNAGKAEISGSDFTGDVSTTGTFTATKKVIAGGGLDVTGEASFAQRPTYAGKTPYDTGNLDLTPYAKLSGAGFLGDVSTTGKLSSSSFSVSADAAFGQRPTFAGKTPWDSANLVTPLDAGSPAAARLALALGGRVTVATIDLSTTKPSSWFVNLPDGFDSFEIDFIDLSWGGTTPSFLITASTTANGANPVPNNPYYYSTWSNATSSAAVSGGRSNAVSSIMVYGSAGTGTDLSTSGTMKFFCPKTTTVNSHHYLIETYGHTSDGTQYSQRFNGQIVSATALQSLIFSAGTGTFVRGKIKVYGVP